MHFPFDPVILLQGIYPREMQTYVHTKSCMQMFVEALFIIAQNWKQPMCPTRVNKQAATHPYNGTCSKKEWTVVTRSSRQEWNAMHCVQWKKPTPNVYIPCESMYMTLWKGKMIGTEDKSVVSRNSGCRGKSDYEGEAKVMELDWTLNCDDGYVAPSICQNSKNCTPESTILTVYKLKKN